MRALNDSVQNYWGTQARLILSMVARLIPLGAWGKTRCILLTQAVCFDHGSVEIPGDGIGQSLSARAWQTTLFP